MENTNKVDQGMEQSYSNKWKILPGSYGEYFSFHDNYIAGCQGNRLSIWQNGILIREVFSQWYAQCYARWLGEKIFWNDTILHARQGQIKCIQTNQIPDQFRVIASDWSKNGTMLTLAIENSGKQDRLGAKTLLLDENGNVLKILQELLDFAAGCVCFGNDYLAIGSRQPTIYNLNGDHLITLEGSMIPKRIQLTDKDAYLFIQTHESIIIWETTEWQQITHLPGPWLNACISSDAACIYAVDFNGNAFEIKRTASGNKIRKLHAPASMVSIDTDPASIVASFSKGPALQWIASNLMDNSFVKFN